MRIVRLVSFVFFLFLTIVTFNLPDDGLSVDGFRSRRLATVLPIMLAAVGMLFPFRGKWELPRVIVAVLGASAATQTLTRSDGFKFVVHVGMWGWVGIVLWFIWTINDRADSDPAISEWLVEWFSQRRMTIPIALLLFIAGVMMVSWEDQAFAGISLSAPFPMETRWERECALFLPFALMLVGLAAARRGRNQAFLALSALFVALAAFGTAYLSWDDPKVGHFIRLRGRAPLVDWTPLCYRLVPLWTILPLWFMLWAIDWIEYLHTGQVTIPRAKEPETERPDETLAKEETKNERERSDRLDVHRGADVSFPRS